LKEVRLSIPAHLHAGNPDLTGDLGRIYGTLGFTIDSPRTLITVRKSNGIEIKGEDQENAKKYARSFFEKFNINGGAEIIIENSIPKHLGMGSQTALALGIGTALSKIYGIDDVSLEEMALKLGRGTVTALGTYGFKLGGLILDGGFRTDMKGKMIPPLIFRKDIPENWFFVVCIPKSPIPKILDIKYNEDEVLNNLKPMKKEISAELSRLVLMQILPSFLEGDLITFGKALTKFNSRLGGFWSDFQEDAIYCDPIVENGIKLMLEKGAPSACQTCWGPTFYSIVDGEKKANMIQDELRQNMLNVGGGDVFYTKSNNRGASASYS
jgi:beta-ribofuranosylaminobenzene 5'-phosphate synthase